MTAKQRAARLAALRDYAGRGGRARAAKLSPGRRLEIARKAALIRHHGRCVECGEPSLPKHLCPRQIPLFPEHGRPTVELP